MSQPNQLEQFRMQLEKLKASGVDIDPDKITEEVIRGPEERAADLAKLSQEEREKAYFDLAVQKVLQLMSDWKGHYKDKGRKLSEETKAKLRGRKGKKSSSYGKDFGKKDYIAISPEGEEIAISNLKKWCEKNNFHYNTALCVVHGRKRHYKGWKFTNKINNRIEIERLKKVERKKKVKRKNWKGFFNGKEIVIYNLTKWCRENNYPLQRARWRLEHNKSL